MPTYRLTYDDLKGELRERIADLEEELEGGREEMERGDAKRWSGGLATGCRASPPTGTWAKLTD